MLSSQRLTPKQEAFAQAYVETGNASEAHRQAGYGPNMSTKTRHEAASRLLANSKVRAMVGQLQAEHRQRHDVTVDSLTDEFDENRELAFQTAQPAAANGATAGKARLHGLDKADAPTVNIAGDNVIVLSDLELARRLAFMLRDSTG
jgi:phage terminase small subunit